MTVIYRFNKYLIAMLIIVMLTGCGSEADIENSGVYNIRYIHRIRRCADGFG